LSSGLWDGAVLRTFSQVVVVSMDMEIGIAAVGRTREDCWAREARSLIRKAG
jgi:hypothetical protein